ncbi:MAG: DUF433 domain-containing protein [Janthinobacterium lividum]
MHYFKRLWPETTGTEFTDSWGTSTFFFETNSEFQILRQLQLFENGNALKYDLEYSEDKFGGLAEEPLGSIDFAEYQTAQQEFEQIWRISAYQRFPEIVTTETVLQGSPRIEGRRLAVGDVVSQTDIEDSVITAAWVYELTLQQVRQALLYCKSLQCVRDNPAKFCHNCQLRVQQEGAGDGEEQENWIRAGRLFDTYFMSPNSC